MYCTILCKLINIALPDIIVEGAINKDSNNSRKDKLIELSFRINSVKSIDEILDKTAEDIIDECRQRDVDLLYQLLKLIV